jgi:hypothetical protein
MMLFYDPDKMKAVAGIIAWLFHFGAVVYQNITEF